MSRVILFSPVGGNDPVSSATLYDGSMLHICRQYRPNKVYLYLSAEMTERHERDNRYGYCIDKLGERLHHEFEVEYIKTIDTAVVPDYDYYYEEFQRILSDIPMEEENQILVNISSGTPAMKSALLLLSVQSEYKLKPIQVVTPVGSINIHTGKDPDYDPEYYWELDGDNEEGAENRCKEAFCPNLSARIKKDILIKHIQAYDYNAALMLAKEIRGDLSDETYYLFEVASARQQLDLKKVNTLSQKYGYDILPVKTAD